MKKMLINKANEFVFYRACGPYENISSKNLSYKKTISNLVKTTYSKASEVALTKNVLQNHNSKQVKSKRADNPSRL